MATIVLAAVGTAVGSSFGGTVLGLSGAVIGRAVGATVGRMIDQRLLGAGASVVESGRIERLRLTGAGEGACSLTLGLRKAPSADHGKSTGCAGVLTSLERG